MTSIPPQSGKSTASTATPASASPQPTQAATSYANAATKKSATPAAPANVSGPAQNERSSVSPVNGQPMQNNKPASGVTIVNGGAPTDPHARKPSVTITSSGLSGNVAPTGIGRPKDLQFGFNGSGSPNMGAAAAAAGTPSQPQAGLGAPSTNPRVTSPQTSPSPIPQQASSGGRPPSTYQAQGNVPNFGSFGETGDANVSYHPDAHPHWILRTTPLCATISLFPWL